MYQLGPISFCILINGNLNDHSRGRDFIYASAYKKTVVQEKKVVIVLNELNEELQGENVLVQQMHDMDEEMHLLYFQVLSNTLLVKISLFCQALIKSFAGETVNLALESK